MSELNDFSNPTLKRIFENVFTKLIKVVNTYPYCKHVAIVGGVGGWGFRARGRERNDGGRSQALEKEDAEISKKTKMEAWIADSVNVVFPNCEHN